MDKSWRDKLDSVGRYEDESLSKWQKFKTGSYSGNTMMRSFARRLARQQEKLDFIEELL